jgi:hypothetical protein
MRLLLRGGFIIALMGRDDKPEGDSGGELAMAPVEVVVVATKWGVVVAGSAGKGGGWWLVGEYV